MSDLIKDLCEWRDYDYCPGEVPHDLLSRAADKIERLTAENERLRNPWISVKEATPPDCRSYAIRSMHMICNNGFVTVGFWHPIAREWHDSGANGGYNITRQVTHWMPLPMPPKDNEMSVMVAEAEGAQAENERLTAENERLIAENERLTRTAHSAWF